MFLLVVKFMLYILRKRWIFVGLLRIFVKKFDGGERKFFREVFCFRCLFFVG